MAVAASYNAGQARIASQLAKQDVDDSLDLQLVEETARYVYRILAAKQLFNAPTTFGFRLRASDLYPPIPYTEITVTKGIADLARFAQQRNQSGHIKEYESLVTGNILVQPQRADLRDKNPYQRRNDL